MPRTGTLASLGNVMQLAFVPSDFDAALDHWTGVMGAGPFFLLPDVALPGGLYRGEPSDPVFTMALGYWGDMQIELIRPENEAPSIYRGDYGVTDRLHHVCILVDSIDEARTRCRDLGIEIVFEAPVGDNGGVIYADPGTGPGNLVELLQPQPGTTDLFAMMREAAQGWDGRDPLRTLG
jgi:methylmalonyl-CoA/ethylmalonyl-CoA epimerase